MYVPNTENLSAPLIKRDDEIVMNENETRAVATRISTVFVIISWYIYGKYALLCLRGLLRHKNFNFLFPLAATLFAFVNNSNDIANYVYRQADCYPFYLLFMGSATLNWAPISWLQAYRLALIAKIYLPKMIAIVVTGTAVVLSCVYCTFYFLNLSLFEYTKTDLAGCAVTNKGIWTPYIMASDIADSVFSLASICIIVFKSINHLKELNTRNEKLNDLVGQGIIELLVIAIAKIIIYPLIQVTSLIPSLDVFWDVLSVIVIISAYNLVNFPYEHSDNKSSRRKNLRKNVFNLIDTSVNNHSSGNGSSNGSMCQTLKSPRSPYDYSPNYEKSVKRENYTPVRETFSPIRENYSSMNSSQNYSGFSTIYNNYNNANYSKIDPNTYNSSVNRDMFNV